MNGRAFVVGVVMVAGIVGCGGGGGSSLGTPTAPAALTSIDLNGTWEESTGGEVVWQLAQMGSAVAGTSRFSQGGGSSALGAVSGQGSITGSVAGGTFTFTDTYATLSRANCSLVATGQLTAQSATEMSGRYTQTDSCDGAVIGTSSGVIRMVKRS